MSDQDFRNQEKQWATRLYGLSLVSEAGFDIADALKAFRILLNAYRRRGSEKYVRNQILRKYPATILAGLTSIASTRYDEGTFWPKVGEATEIKIDQIYQAELSDAFRYGLDRLRLSRFDTPQRNIGEILMHAGIPVSSAESFLHFLVERDTKRPDLTADDFCAWVGGMTREAAAARGIDAPTWRFLKEGGEVSSDLTDRLLSFLDAAARNRQDLCDDALQSVPRHLAEEIERLHRSGRLHISSKSAKSRRHDSGPGVLYKDGLVQIALPQMESPMLGEHQWRFTTTGETWSTSLGSSWTSDRSSASFETVSQPTTDIVVSYPLLERDWILHLIDPHFPLLAFDFSSGKLLPSSHQLPQSWVWLAFPSEEGSPNHHGLEVDGTLTLREVANTPTGWRGWKFIAADLRWVKKLRPTGVTSHWRLVSSTKRPALQGNTAAPIVRTQSGSLIYCSRPRLILPGSTGTADESSHAEWRVQILDPSDSVITSFSIQAETDSIEIDPWNKTSGVLLGEFQIRAIGTLGRSAAFDISIAESLSVQAFPSFRWISKDGSLEPALIQIEFADKVHELRIKEDELSEEFVLTNGDQQLPIVISPRHMWMAAERPGTPDYASVAPLLVEIEHLPQTTLQLNIGPEQRGSLKLHSEHTTLAEELLSTGSSDIAKLQLARFYDSCRAAGGGELYFHRNTGVSLIGRIRPKKLISGVTLTGDTISLDRIYDNLDLQLDLQLDNAPWLRIAPIRYLPGQTAASMRVIAQGRGPLTASVRPFDPWDLGGSLKRDAVDQENRFRINEMFDESYESIEDCFIRWVAGLSPIPTGPTAMAFAIDIYGTLGQKLSHEHATTLLRDIATLSRSWSVAFMDALSDSRWSQQTHTRLIAEGWPATTPRAPGPNELGIWRRSPFLGLLNIPGDLSAAEVRLQLSDWLGADAVSILSVGSDPSEKACAFNANVATLADKPQSVQDALWKAYAAVPEQILSNDQRGIQARELFDHRRDARLRNLVDVSPAIVDKVTSFLDTEVGNHSIRPLQVRGAPYDWRQLPQVSLALAFTARLAARASNKAIDLYDRSQHWYAELATCAPAFVEQDLILAELWLTRWENP